MSDLIITIGRENGSGGREIGSILSQMLGIPCYDREIIEATADRTGLSVDKVKEREESSGNPHAFFWGIPPSNPMFITQSEIIRDLASNGPCIFIGRCADFVLRDFDNVVKVFVHAPLPDRVKRSSSRNNISCEDAEKRIATKDYERAGYYKRYTGMTWGYAPNYDLSIDTGRIGVQNAANMISEYIRMAGIGF